MHLSSLTSLPLDIMILMCVSLVQLWVDLVFIRYFFLPVSSAFRSPRASTIELTAVQAAGIVPFPCNPYTLPFAPARATGPAVSDTAAFRGESSLRNRARPDRPG